ncbi:MAG: M23 family metallopeptidase [Verrucomicrobiota bacterium]|nr:M23 family metallopeptidase [Verrucomicrobiota bacterium]
MSRAPALLTLISLIIQNASVLAQAFQLPTPNRAILLEGQEERYFTPTIGRTWESGTFGCVRSDGWQMHEGIDIKCLERDKKGEPIDPVSAAADGIISYINSKPGLSNYGNYIVMRHQIDGMDIYTLYAHLRRIAGGLKVGQYKKTGEIIATMGRTANTRQGISRERAHLHFEINLLANESFPAWYKNRFPGQRNDHGKWNGQNLIGLNPWDIFVSQKKAASARRQFSLLKYIKEQPVLCRIKVIKPKNFKLLKRYPLLVTGSHRGELAGYEVSLNPNGVPVRIIPIATEQLEAKGSAEVVVDPQVYKAAPCRKLVFKKGQKWVLTAKGMAHLDLITK